MNFCAHLKLIFFKLKQFSSIQTHISKTNQIKTAFLVSLKCCLNVPTVILPTIDLGEGGGQLELAEIV